MVLTGTYFSIGEDNETVSGFHTHIAKNPQEMLRLFPIACSLNRALSSSLPRESTAMPPGLWRVLRRVSEIVRQEMDRAGAQELMLPILQPKEIWERSGRWQAYVDEGLLFHFEDRKQAEVCLGADPRGGDYRARR